MLQVWFLRWAVGATLPQGNGLCPKMLDITSICFCAAWKVQTPDLNRKPGENWWEDGIPVPLPEGSWYLPAWPGTPVWPGPPPLHPQRLPSGQTAAWLQPLPAQAIRVGERELSTAAASSIRSRTNLKIAYSEGFFHIFKVKADFPEPAQHPARYLILFKYPNCCSGFSRTSAYPPTDKTALHLRASLRFLPVHQAKNTSPIPARHPGLPSDKQIIGWNKPWAPSSCHRCRSPEESAAITVTALPGSCQSKSLNSGLCWHQRMTAVEMAC